jgi:hypothetical protein
MLLLQNAFTPKCFYSKMLLLQNAFAPKCFYSKMLLLQNAFTPNAFTPKRFYSKMLLLQNVFTLKCFYSEILLPKCLSLASLFSLVLCLWVRPGFYPRVEHLKGYCDNNCGRKKFYRIGPGIFCF